MLVHALLAVAEAADERLVALLGAPDYYRRFGFVPADRARRHPARPGVGRALPGAAAERAAGVRRGTFRYAEPFDAGL